MTLMITRVELDVVDLPELGQVYSAGGPVDVALVAPVGPAGHPVVAVSGAPGAVLEYLLDGYAPELPAALELMINACRPAGE